MGQVKSGESYFIKSECHLIPPMGQVCAHFYFTSQVGTHTDTIPLFQFKKNIELKQFEPHLQQKIKSQPDSFFVAGLENIKLPNL